MSDVVAALESTVAPERRRVHVIGAGPVGLMTAALLQWIEGLTVLLYEQRADYTRSRMVHLEPYLVADTIESYRAAQIDEDDIDAVCDPREIEQGLPSGSRSQRI